MLTNNEAALTISTSVWITEDTIHLGETAKAKVVLGYVSVYKYNRANDSLDK